MDYFKLLPVPARKLARAMMGAAFANVALIFSLIAFASLIAYGAQSGPAAALAGVAAVLLDLILAVVASTVAVAVFGPVISSRRGRDFGTMAFALVITLLSVASGLVPVVARRLTDGHSPALSAVVKILIIVILLAAWPPLLARRLTMSVRAGGRAKRHRAGVLVCVIPAFDGNTSLLPFAGLLFATIAASCFTNFYGDDGTSLWRTLVVPGAYRADLRGREWAWFLVVGPASLLLTVVFTAVSGQPKFWPIVLAAEPALVLASTGLLALISVVSVNGPTADGGPSPMRVLKTHLALIAVPAAALFPVAALLIAGTAGHLLWLQWLAVPAGIAWGALLGGRCGQLAQRRLDQQAPEIFSRVRGPAA